MEVCESVNRWVIYVGKADADKLGEFPVVIQVEHKQFGRGGGCCRLCCVLLSG